MMGNSKGFSNGNGWVPDEIKEIEDDVKVETKRNEACGAGKNIAI